MSEEIKRVPRMIILTSSIGQAVPYDPAIHRQHVLSQITEFDIWPDLNDCQQHALKILTAAADMELADFHATSDENLRSVAWAQIQYALIDQRRLADQIIDDLIADGDIYFGTEADRLAQIVPEPADYNDLPEADTRHPNNPINIAKRKELEDNARAEISSLR